MKGFIIQPTYRIHDNKAYVYLFGRLDNGKSFLTINSFKPYFFIRTKDVQKAKKIKDVKFDTEDTALKNFKKEKCTKIILDIPTDVPKLRKLFEEQDIACYEADIRFAYRFMIDNDITSVMEIRKNPKPIKYQFDERLNVDKVFFEPKLNSCKSYQPQLKILSIDIETDMSASKIYSIALHSDDIEEVFLVRKPCDCNAKFYDSEKDMLSAFVKRIVEIDPDIITGWNVIDFDLKVLITRMKKLKVEPVFGRTDYPAKLRIESSYFTKSNANVSGRIVLDGIDLLRMSYVKLEDYKLNTAAKEILGDKKRGVDFSKENINDLIRDNPNRLIEYNLKDARLVREILKKKKIIELTIQRSLLTGMPPDRVGGSVASLDSMYLRKIRKIGYVVNSLPKYIREERITGGFVRESKYGLHDYVLVFDFKSLYPSIMITFNIDPLSYDPNGEIQAPNGIRFNNNKSIIPDILKNLWKSRDIAKKENNELASWALKITMNSIYGVMASPACRFYSTEIANAITTFARYLIQQTADFIEEKGYDVIYGDTDSVFVKSKADNMDDAKVIGKKIRDDINSFYKRYVKEKYGRDSLLELEFEKVYKSLLLPKQRNTMKGAKKRYAGIIVKDGKEKIDVVGLEIVRRDWTQLAKKFQKELLLRVFAKKPLEKYIQKFVKDLNAGTYDDLLIYKKAIRKDLREYTKTTPPHIKAARKLDKLTTSIIEYVMTKDGPEPLQKITSPIDYSHYIEKQLKPIANSILLFFDKEFDKIISSQSHLGDF